MPYAGPGEARDAIYTFVGAGLLARLPTFDQSVIIFEDKQTPAAPTDKRPYFRIQVVHQGRSQRSIGGAGGRRFRAKFTITIRIYTDIGQGMDDYQLAGALPTDPVYDGADKIAGALLRVFDGQTTGLDGISFYRARSQEYGTVEGRFQTNVLVEGDYDTIR
jgi:hypothetical protein